MAIKKLPQQINKNSVNSKPQPNIPKINTKQNTAAVNTTERTNSDVSIFDEQNNAYNSSTEETYSPNLLFNIFDGILGIFGHDDEEDTKDSSVDPTKQGTNGDCWILAGVNSLSYTEEGRKAISEALDYQDGYTVVHFKGLNISYEITDKELRKAKKSGDYASGDDDMILIELAMQKAHDDLASLNMVLDPNHSPSFMKQSADLEVSTEERESTYGGDHEELWYFLTGEIGVQSETREDMIEMLDAFQANNGKNIALGCGILGFHLDNVVYDVSGEEHTLPSPHAYSIKAVTDDTVTVINPWDSSEEIVITREDFLDKFTNVRMCDFSQQNGRSDLIQKNYTLDEFGNKNFTFDCSDVTFHDDEGNIVHYAKQVEKYSKDGEYLSSTYLDENGNPVKVTGHKKKGITPEYTITCANKNTVKTKDGTIITYYDENGKVKFIEHKKKDGGNISQILYSDNGKFALQTKWENNSTNDYICEVDSEGNVVSESEKIEYSLYKIICIRELINYPNLSIEDIYYYASLTDEEWEQAKDSLD